MEMKVQIPFQDLLSAVKNLTPAEKDRLKKELSGENTTGDDRSAFIEMLLKGPVYSDDDIKIIEENRKSIAKWRTKS